MLIVEFSHKGEEIEINDALWQHDYGQKIQIKGLDLPEVFEVHFAWKDIEKAKVVTGSTVDGVSIVDIPNIALEQRRAITAYIYLSNAVEGETVNTILMTVNKRKAPENFEIPEKIDLFHHTIEATAEYQRRAQESEKKASTQAADAEAWAHGREDHTDQEQDNAKYYAEQAAASQQDAELLQQRVSDLATQAQNNIGEAQQQAIKTITEQQGISIQKIKNQTAESEDNLKNTIRAAEQIKTDLDTEVENATPIKQGLDDSNTAAIKTKVDLDKSNTIADQIKAELEALNTTASKTKTNLDGANKTATDLTGTLENEISEGIQTKIDIQTTGEKAMSNLQAEATKQQEFIKTSIDDTLSISGKAADAAVTGKKIDSLKEDLSNKITKFYASNQGETHLQDSDNGKIMDMMLYGKSEQATTTGAQLLDVETAYADSDVAEINGNKIIFASIQASSPDLIRNYGNIEAGTYTVSAKPCLGATNARIEIYINGIKKADSFDSESPMRTFSIESGNLSIKTFSTKPENSVGIVYGGVADLIMCKGDTACAWEPYTGGVPSPNPDYPQEIKAVENPEVKICGKNLLNYMLFPDSAALLGVTIKNNNDGSFTATGTKEKEGGVNLQGKKCVIPKGTYVMSGFLNELYIVISFVKNGVIQYLQRTSKSFTFDEDTEITPYIQVADNYKNEPVTIYPQIERGSTNTSYEPYKKEQTVTLPYTLNAIPVDSGGNIIIDGQKYIADYVDVERGKLIQKIGTVQIANISLGTVEGSKNTYILKKGRTGILTGKASTEINNITCTHFGNNGEVWVSKVNCISWSGGTPRQIRVKTDKSAEELLTLLNNGNVYIDYVLAEPVETDLTPEEIQAFKELTTYYPVTNISVNSDQLDGYTVFNYPVSMANGWNYVKQQLSDNRDYIYNMDAKTQDIDTQSTEAYVNSEYAVALTELEVM